MNLFCGHGHDLKKIGPDQFYRFDFYRILTKLSTKLFISTVHTMLVYFWILVQPSLRIQTKLQTKKKQQQTGKPWRQKFTDGFQTPPPFLFLKGSNLIFTMCLSRFVHYLIFLSRFWLVSFILFFSWKYRRQLKEHCSIRSSSLRVYRYTGTC